MIYLSKYNNFVLAIKKKITDDIRKINVNLRKLFSFSFSYVILKFFFFKAFLCVNISLLYNSVLINCYTLYLRKYFKF
jgi:hypothetical protein